MEKGLALLKQRDPPDGREQAGERPPGGRQKSVESPPEGRHVSVEVRARCSSSRPRTPARGRCTRLLFLCLVVLPEYRAPRRGVGAPRVSRLLAGLPEYRAPRRGVAASGVSSPPASLGVAWRLPLERVGALRLDSWAPCC